MDEVSGVMCAIVEDSIEGPNERGPGVRTWQDQRMAAIGRLTSGIAHDLNNLLTIVMVMTELLLDDLPSESPQHTMARDIRVATERATSLTDELLMFERRQRVAPKAVDLNGIVTDTSNRAPARGTNHPFPPTPPCGYDAGMSIALSVTGVAFAAFCVWLSVRIINRRERWAKRLAMALAIGLPILYLASFGPVCWIVAGDGHERSQVPELYVPISWGMRHSEVVSDIFYNYGLVGIRPGTRAMVPQYDGGYLPIARF